MNIVVEGGAPAPEGLVDAVLAYESALAADDLDALASAFEHGPHPLRGDRNGLLIGHERITGFRSRRGGAGPRDVLELRIHLAGDDAAHVTTVNAPSSGGRGLVTQLWRRGADGAWRIVAAHVTAPSPALDPRIWRVLGVPLVAGAGEGPLAGETVAVKDLFAIAGQRIGVGVKAYLAEAPVEDENAPAVQALLDAGADVLGIAQTDQFAYSVAGLNPDYGTPPNAVVPGAIPGGSSSGPASAVALGQASIGLGSDTAGSIRVPASYQGLWGLRPTHGAVSLERVAPLAPRYDTAGWLTRDGETMRRVAAVGLAGRDAVAPAPGFLAAPAAMMSCARGVRDAFDAALATLAGAGVRPLPVDVPALDDMLLAFRLTQSAEAWRADGPWVEAHPGALAPDVQERFDFARDVTPEQEADALADAGLLAARLDLELGDRILLVPSTASAAPRLDADEAELESRRRATLSITAIAGLTGRPALSVPVLDTPDGPVGLCLVGPRGSELALVDAGLALAAILRNPGETSFGHTV
ncbi:AtzH-like domain-containing protein [Demequina mangrovi]|uniref:Asp-tRNAAsn/Glu-tRNAGln amidotransferase A subunit n=1 Tax=Demequina mangrovi TaxID=1043493 RepID=A0A1H6X455_9MICO|nr:AtzH-like domain-containing protein [Demequina mangrovi]SEJ23838.1 Asp-tRNAAsn/Glu-tRNAGln amidotransferase A subunit [Demequina mangrovi]